MKQVIRIFGVILIAGGIFWGMPEEARAERKESPELEKKIGWDIGSVYDCGTSTVDGILEVHSDSHSLKAGDIVDVQMIYNGEKNKIGNYWGTSMDIGYDNSVLEYVETTFEDDYIKTYRPNLRAYEWDDKMNSMQWRCDNYIGFEGNGCIATLHFKVKKKAESVQIYFYYIYLYGTFWDNKKESYDVLYCTDLDMGDDKTMQLWLESGFVVPNVDDWVDVLTVNITDSTSIPPRDSTLTLTTTHAQGSKEITVPINIEKNDGFNLLGLTLNYDASLFTYDSLEIDDSLKSKISLDSIYESPGSGRIKASFIALEDITDVGDFLKLKLKVKDGVPAGTTSSVGVEITQVGNKAETSMSGTGTTCAVSITDTSGGEEQQPMLGDVNADKKIDLVDAVYILQNYNQVREFTNAQKTVADVSKDGNVDLIDALMILKYFNGEITSF